MFLQTGGGGKGIRPNQQQQQQQQQQHHQQQQQQQHHQSHHPHTNLQQQQHQQPPHHPHQQQQQQSHSHHPHQPQQQHHLLHQPSHQATPYYSYQLSQPPPPQQQQHQQQHQQAQNVQAPSPPSQVTGTPASSATSSNSSLSMAGIGTGGGGGNNSNTVNITRQHYGHPNAGTAAIMQTPTTTAFMTTTYLQQQYHQQSAVMAAAAAAAQYNTVAAAAAAAAAHSPQTATQSAAQSLYVQTQQQQHQHQQQQQQQQQHHQTLHQAHHQPTLHTHYYHATAGAPPTPPPHLHPAHHHPAQQHQLRGVLTAPHQRQGATYLLPASAIFALPPGSLTAAPPPRSSLITTHQQSGATGAPVSVTPLLTTAAVAARNAVAGGGPTTYITQPFCQPPLPMGATTLTQPPPLLATAASMAPPTLQTYGHLPPPTASTSSTSLNATETVKPRPHAIPIIHPITHENILDPKPQKKSTAVEAKPAATVEQSSEVAVEQQKATVVSSNSKDNNDKSTTAVVPKLAPTVTSSKEKIDQQMQTDAIKDKSSSTTKLQPKGNTVVGAADAVTVLSSPTASASAASNLDDEDGDDDVLYTHSKKLEQELPQVIESDANDEYVEEFEEQITIVVEELASQVTNEAANYDYVDQSTASQVKTERNEDNLQYEENYDENQINKGKNLQIQMQAEMHDEEAHVVPHDFPATDKNEFAFADNSQEYEQQNEKLTDPIKKLTSAVNQNQQEPKEKPMRHVKTTTHQPQQLQQQQKLKSNKQTTSNVSCTTSAAVPPPPPSKAQTTKQSKLILATTPTTATLISTSMGGSITTAPLIKSQKLSPATSGGASSSSTTSTPTHSSNMQQQQHQQQHHQQQQQHQQQKPKAITTAGVGGSGAPNVNTKKKNKQNKDSQKKLKQKTTTGVETSNRNNNNNNKNSLNNVSLTNNNILLMTDINSARISNLNIRQTTIATNAEASVTEVVTTGKLSKKQQQQHQFHHLATTTESNNNSSGGNSSTSMRSISTKQESICDSTPSSTRATSPAQRKHLKTQEIVAQFLQPINSKAKSPEEQQLQFLNSSASACEDEEEINARLQLQQQQHQQQEEAAAKDIRFGDFTDDKEPAIDATPATGTTFTKVPNTSHRSKSSNLPSDTVDCSNSYSIATATAGTSNKGSAVNQSKSYKNSGVTPKARQMHMVTSPPPKGGLKYTLEELKKLADSSESRKPPMVSCHKGDCISQLFVSRQQQHHLTHNHAHMSALALQQQHMRQQYQNMNFNESIDFGGVKRGRPGGHAKKPHEHQAVGASGGAAGGGGNAANQSQPNYIRVQLSLKEEIKLSECENAWQPETLRSHSSNNSPSGSNDDIDIVLKKVRGILNKLTPDNFDVLLKTMTTISMNTQEKMQQVMLLIFEKTISEPNFAPTYAKFCKVLFHEIKAENKSQFTGSLITRIQEEFESNVNDADAKKLKLQPIVDRLENSSDTKERLELRAELEDQEYQFRRRAWGTVRFIGEMYKLQSLTSDRVLLCIESLLKHGCEEKIEYMCKLLTTVGHLLEGNTPDQYSNNVRMDKIFRKIQEFVNKSSRAPALSSNKATAAAQQSKISSRVRFMMQDVMDLRSRSWDQPLAQTQTRRNTSKPDDRQQNTAGNTTSGSTSAYEKNTATSSVGGGGGGGGGSGGGRLAYGNQNNSRQTRQSPTEQRESNYFLQKPIKFSAQQDQQQQKQEKIELLKLNFRNFDDLTQSNTQLGNSSNYIWQNMVGRQPSNISSTSTTKAPLSLNSNSTSKTVSSGGAGVTIKRQNTNQFHVLEKQDKLLETTQQSTDNDEKLSFTTKDSQELLNRLIEEVLDTRKWHDEALDAWQLLNTSHQVILLQYLLTDYLHLAAVRRQQRKACSKLFAHLLRHDTNFKRSSVFAQAYKQFGVDFPDLLVDVPNGWTYVFEFLGPLLHERLLQFSDIWLSEWAEDTCFTEKFVKALISYFTQEFGANYARDIWHKEFKLDKGQIFFMNDIQKAANFLAGNKFQYICERDAKPPKPHISSNNTLVAEQLERIEFLLKTASECDLAIDYINTNVHININFIRNLTKFFCCDYAMTTATEMPNSTGQATTNDSIPSASSENNRAAVQIDTELFRNKCIPLLRLCIDGHEVHEIACLDAIVNSLQQLYDDADSDEASEMICSIFDILDECDIIPKECFEKWYKGLLENDATAVDDGLSVAGAAAAESCVVATDSKRSHGDVKFSQQQKNRLTNKLHAYMEKIL